MEQTQDSSLFGLGVDPNTKTHLSEAARWAKFLSIVGFVVCGLIVLVGIFFGSVFSSINNRYGGNSGADVSGALASVMAVFYVIVAVIYFFPCLFLYRFATKMKVALASNDQEVLNSSFQNLKIMFRYVGIIMIIVLSLYAIIFLVTLAGLGASRF